MPLFPSRPVESLRKPPANRVVLVNRSDSLFRDLFEDHLFNSRISPDRDLIGAHEANLGGTREHAQLADGFTGTIGLINLPDHGNYAAGDFTFRMIFRPNVLTASNMQSLWKGPGSFGTAELGFMLDTNGDISLFSIGNTDGGHGQATGMTTGKTWDFVVKRAGSTVSPYVNGVRKGTPGTNGGTTPNTGSFLYFGGDGSRGNTPNLTVFRWTFWTRALTDMEIRRLYEQPYGYYSPNHFGERRFGPPAAAAITTRPYYYALTQGLHV